MQRHALQPQPERLPVNGENGFEGHQRDPRQPQTQRCARQRFPAQRQGGIKHLRLLMVFNMHAQRAVRAVEAPVVDHVHRVKGRNVKRFRRRRGVLARHRVIMPFIPRRVTHFGEHPTQGAFPVIAVVKIHRIKMKAEITQLGQKHDPPRRTFAGQVFQPRQGILLKRRAQRIVRIIKCRRRNAVPAHADGGQRVQLIQIEPGHKHAVGKVVRFRRKPTMAQCTVVKAAVHLSCPLRPRERSPRPAHCARHLRESRCTSTRRRTSSAGGRLFRRAGPGHASFSG